MDGIQRVEWISKEKLEIVGLGVFKKGERFNCPDNLAKQLIAQGLVKDAYVSKEDREKEKKSNKNRGRV